MREEKILSVLIGLAGACCNNPKTENTDSLVIRALAFPVLCGEWDEEAAARLVEEIHQEKYRVAPGCKDCLSPCGNTSDYDLRRIYEAEKEIRDVKLDILSELKKLAVRMYREQETNGAISGDIGCLFRALLCVSYDLEKERLLEIREELRKEKGRDVSYKAE